MGKIRVHLKIHGLVQGVCFRAATEDQALRLNLTGWVRNGSDGSVEAVAEGEEEKVEEWVRWCRQGPPAATVSRVEVERLKYQGEFESFGIRYGL